MNGAIRYLPWAGAAVALLALVFTAAAASAGPDLTVSSGDITFSKTPTKGDTISINATIHNDGDTDSGAFKMQFYDGDPASGGVQINGDQDINALGAGNATNATVQWDTTSVVNGTHSIFVVVDATGLIAEDDEGNNKASNTVKVNLGPVANFSASANTTLTLTAITFDGSTSYDMDNGSIVTYFWKFEDGTFGTGKTVDHSYSDNGVYNVTLVVTDNDGGTASITRNVTILNRAPMPSAPNEFAYTYDTIYLDATNSTDDDGYLANISWNFGGGKVLYGQKVAYYWTDGYSANIGGRLYIVNLTVRDDDGTIAYTNITYTIYNRPPSPAIWVERLKVNTSDMLSFDGSNSSDRDGSVTNYTWLFPGNAIAYGAKVDYIFSLPNGSYNVTLVVIDDDGDIGTVSKTIRVGNKRPVAVPGLDRSTYTLDPVVFNASHSFDPDGYLVNFTWDLGDGNISKEMEVAHNYTDNGMYQVSLVVTDEDGATSEPAKLWVTVLNRAPHAEWPDMTTSTYTNESFNGSMSYDDDGTIVNYTWNCAGLVQYGYKATYNWTKKGFYPCTLMVTDDDGATASWEFNVTVMNSLPKGVLQWSNPGVPLKPVERETITFDGSNSSDRDGIIVNYTWSFGDQNTSYVPLANHSYAAPGTYTVILTVTDDDGGTSTVSESIRVFKYNAPPVARINITTTPLVPFPLTFYSNTTINFDGSASSDSDGTLVDYTWDFGDASGRPRGKVVSHRFATPATSYTVRLTVTDDGGQTNSTTVVVYIEQKPNEPPVADAGAGAASGLKDEEVVFDATYSFDPDGSIVNYTWDFGDGSRGYGLRTVHRYSTSGLFTARLTVVDNSGSPNSTGFTVSITTPPPPNRPPVVDIKATATTVNTNQEISFDGSGSYDPDRDEIISYSWIFGDGTSGSGPVALHRYRNDGTYMVTLTVMDKRGAAGSNFVLVYVRNVAPVAQINLTAGSVKTYEAVGFDGTKSGDSDGTITTYFWDFGDGITAVGMKVNHIYIYRDAYTVTLTVTDDDGASTKVSVTVRVANREPMARAGGNITSTAGDPVVFDGSGSGDPDGSIVEYRWAFGDGKTGVGLHPQHIYDTAGNYTVTLTVKDDSGDTATASILVKVTPPPIVVVPPVKPTPKPQKTFIPGLDAAAALAGLALVALVGRTVMNRRR